MSELKETTSALQQSSIALLALVRNYTQPTSLPCFP